MLEEFKLNGFKPFGSQQIARLAPITLIYGPNSGGKSSVIQALMLLKQTVEGATHGTGLISRGSLVDLGSYKALVHLHNVNRRVEMQVKFSPDSDRVPARSGRYPYPLRSVSLSYDSSQLAEVCYEVSPFDLLDSSVLLPPGLDKQPMLLNLKARRGLSERDARGSEEPDALAFGDRQADTFMFSDRKNLLAALKLALAQWRGSRDPEAKNPEARMGTSLDTLCESLMRSEVEPAQSVPSMLVARSPDGERAGRGMEIIGGPAGVAATRVRNALYMAAAQYKASIRSLRYLGPLRLHPERHYVLQGGKPMAVGKRGEFAPHMLYLGSSGLTRSINNWFKKCEIPYRLQVKALDDAVTGTIIVLSLVDRRTKVTVAPSDVGFGIGQFLPVLVQGLVDGDREQIVCVEQPEIHLHPRLQAHLADFFIETVRERDRRRRCQWIVETHSEALMLRLQRRIREKVLPARDVSVLYVDPGQAGSSIREIRLDDNGDFCDPWPQGFFAERFGDLFGTKS